MRGVGGHDGHPDQRPPVQVEMTGLGGADVVLAPSSATIGRTTDRFSLSEWTSPRSRSSASATGEHTASKGQRCGPPSPSGLQGDTDEGADGAGGRR